MGQALPDIMVGLLDPAKYELDFRPSLFTHLWLLREKVDIDKILNYRNPVSLSSTYRNLNYNNPIPLTVTSTTVIQLTYRNLNYRNPVALIVTNLNYRNPPKSM
jgi:hypothetical protein